MEFTLEDTVRYDFDRSFYWARILVRDEDGDEGKALIGAGVNYITDHLGLYSRANITDEHLAEWVSQAIAKLRREMPKIVPDHVYYYVDSFTPEGRDNGLKFLREEIVP